MKLSIALIFASILISVNAQSVELTEIKLNKTIPYLIKIDESIPEVSSTALRYLYTGLEIKNFVDNNNLKSKRIIELGCGYGGQSIILQDLISCFFTI